MPYNLKDAALVQSGNLPNGAATTYTTGLDLGLDAYGELAFRGEFEIEAPAIAVGPLANGATMTYDVVLSANANLSSPVVFYPGVLVQTGAGGVGAAAATFRFALPSSPGSNGPTVNSLRYLGLRATNSAAGNASALPFTLTPVF